MIDTLKSKETSQMLNSEQNPEECDPAILTGQAATDDDSSNAAWPIVIKFSALCRFHFHLVLFRFGIIQMVIFDHPQHFRNSPCLCYTTPVMMRGICIKYF